MASLPTFPPTPAHPPPTLGASQGLNAAGSQPTGVGMVAGASLPGMPRKAIEGQEEDRRRGSLGTGTVGIRLRHPIRLATEPNLDKTREVLML